MMRGNFWSTQIPVFAEHTNLWVSPGFMLFMLGCMGTFPCGSLCLLFWWRSRSRRPNSSHHDDSRATRETHMDTLEPTFCIVLTSTQHTHFFFWWVFTCGQQNVSYQWWISLQLVFKSTRRRRKSVNPHRLFTVNITGTKILVQHKGPAGYLVHRGRGWNEAWEADGDKMICGTQMKRWRRRTPPLSSHLTNTGLSSTSPRSPKKRSSNTTYCLIFKKKTIFTDS